ncbi:MAG: hypothetical protein AB8B93_03855 [Pseudomonadales bacterium]
MITRTHTAQPRLQRRILGATLVAALLALFGSAGVLADTTATATTASALLEATSANNLEQLNQNQAAGYDWTLAIAFLFGTVGLVWMRRHISQL